MSKYSTWIGLLALAVIAAAVGARPIEDGDLFWTLSLGRWIVENGSVWPEVDPFTYNAQDAPVLHEWLAQAGLFTYTRGLSSVFGESAGLLGLRALGAVLCGSATIGVYTLLRRVDPLWALPGAAVWWLMAAPHGVVRPHLLAWLPALVVAHLWLGRRPRLVLLAVVCALWANLHASVLLAPAWALAALLTGLTQRWLHPESEDQTRLWGGRLLVSGAATLAQPAGWHLWPYALNTPAVNRELSNEWWPLWRADVWTARPALFASWLGVVALCVLMMVVVIRRRRLQRLFPGPWLAFAATIHAGSTRRMTAYLYLAIAGVLAELSETNSSRARRIAAILVSAVIVVLTVPETAGWSAPGATRAGVFPHQASAVVGAMELKGRPVHPDGWGGFLTWQHNGRFAVYADGRWPLVGRQVIADGVTMMTRRDPALFKRYQVDWMLQPTSLMLRTRPPDPSKWALAWRDRTAVLLFRRGPAWEANVAQACAFYRDRPALVAQAKWHVRVRAPKGVATPTDVPSVLTFCSP